MLLRIATASGPEPSGPAGWQSRGEMLWVLASWLLPGVGLVAFLKPKPLQPIARLSALISTAYFIGVFAVIRLFLIPLESQPDIRSPDSKSYETLILLIALLAFLLLAGSMVNIVATLMGRGPFFFGVPRKGGGPYQHTDYRQLSPNMVINERIYSVFAHILFPVPVMGLLRKPPLHPLARAHCWVGMLTYLILSRGSILDLFVSFLPFNPPIFAALYFLRDIFRAGPVSALDILMALNLLAAVLGRGPLMMGERELRLLASLASRIWKRLVERLASAASG